MKSPLSPGIRCEKREYFGDVAIAETKKLMGLAVSLKIKVCLGYMWVQRCCVAV